MKPEIQSPTAPDVDAASILPSLCRRPVLCGYKWALDGMEEHLNAARYSTTRNIASLLLKRTVTTRLGLIRSKLSANDAVSLGEVRKLGLLVKKNRCMAERPSQTMALLEKYI
jgi:hypothetical protein